MRNFVFMVGKFTIMGICIRANCMQNYIAKSHDNNY